MGIKDIFIRSMKAAFGLVLFSFGTYLTVQANIGVAPWDVFSKGISFHSPFTYGQASIMISIILIAIDLLMKEKIGIGTILDAVIVGLSLDFFEQTKMVPESENFIIGFLMITVGLFIMAYAQYFYMVAGLCCGPRDSFLVGVGKRLRKIPIGVVNIGILATVFVIGFFLDGPAGIGSIYSVVAMGTIQQIVFNILHFEPREITHVSIREMIMIKKK